MGFFPVAGHGTVAPPAQQRQYQQTAQAYAGSALGRQQRRSMRGTPPWPSVPYVVGHTTADSGSTSSPVAIALPPGTQAGDFAILQVQTAGTQAPTFSGITAWTASTSNGAGSGSTCSAIYGFWYWKILTAGDVATGSVTLTPVNTGCSWAWSLTTVRGVDTTTNNAGGINGLPYTPTVTGPGTPNTPTYLNYTRNALFLEANLNGTLLATNAAAPGGYYISFSGATGRKFSAWAAHYPDHVGGAPVTVGNGIGSGYQGNVLSISFLLLPQQQVGTGAPVPAQVRYNRSRLSAASAVVTKSAAYRRRRNDRPWVGFDEPTVPSVRTTPTSVFTAGPSAGQTLTINRPAGCQEGDLLIFGVTDGLNNPALVPSDWVLIRRTNVLSGAGGLSTYYRYVVSNDPITSWQVTMSGSQSGGFVFCVPVQNADINPTKAIQEHTITQVASATSLALSSINTHYQPVRGTVLRLIEWINPGPTDTANMPANYRTWANAPAFSLGNNQTFGVFEITNAEGENASTPVGVNDVITFAHSQTIYSHNLFLCSPPPNTGGAPPPPKHRYVPRHGSTLIAQSYISKVAGVGRSRRFDPPPPDYPLTCAASFGSAGTYTSGATVTSLALPNPAGLAAGDLMLAFLTTPTAASTITPPSGWTVVQSASTNGTYAWYQKIATAADVSAGNATFSLSSANWAGLILRYPGGVYAVGSGVGTTNATTQNAQPIADSTLIQASPGCVIQIPWAVWNSATATVTFTGQSIPWNLRANSVHSATPANTLTIGDWTQPPGGMLGSASASGGVTATCGTGTLAVLLRSGAQQWVPAALDPARSPNIFGQVWRNKFRGRYNLMPPATTPGGISPALVNTSQGTFAAGTSFNIPLPAGSVATDLLVVMVEQASAAATLSLGSSLVSDHASTQYATAAVTSIAGHKFLSSTDISNGFVTITSNTSAVLFYFAASYRNTDGTVGVAGSSFNASGDASVTTHPAQSLTSSVTGVALSIFYNANAVTSMAQTLNPPTWVRHLNDATSRQTALEQLVPVKGQIAGAGLSATVGTSSQWVVGTFVIQASTSVSSAFIPPILDPARRFSFSLMARLAQRRGKYFDPAGLWGGTGFPLPVTYPGPLVGDRMDYDPARNRWSAMRFRRAAVWYWLPTPPPNQIQLFDSAGFSDSLSQPALGLAPSLTDSANLIDLILRTLTPQPVGEWGTFSWGSVPWGGSVSPITLLLLRQLADGAAALDHIGNPQIAGTLNDGAAAAESLAEQLVFLRMLADGAASADSMARLLTQVRMLADGAAALDALTAALVFARTLSDGAAAADVLSSLSVFARALSDNAAALDSLVMALTELRTLSDGAAAADALTAALVLARALSDGAAAADTLTSNATLMRALTDGAAALDSLLASFAMSRLLTDGAAANDALSRLGTLVRDLADGAAADDLLGGTLVFVRALADGAAALDALIGAGGKSANLSDGAAAGDGLVRLLVLPPGLTDDAAALDALSGSRTTLRVLVDGAAALDALEALSAFQRPLSDGASAEDALTLLLDRIRALVDGAAAGDFLEPLLILIDTEHDVFVVRLLPAQDRAWLLK